MLNVAVNLKCILDIINNKYLKFKDCLQAEYKRIVILMYKKQIRKGR